MTALETLKQYFGYDTFRDGQEKLIDDIISGKDVLGIMPTGAGKSMCFQIPALMTNGITLIISPLISLMKDQVNALNQSGIAAAFINSSLNEWQIQKALHNAKTGMYKLLYVAPERLLSYDFLSFAQSEYIEISMLTVDEAHCISQWGQDFRPSYAKIPEFIAQLNKRPVVSAFTATATPIVREDIIKQLVLNNPTVLVSGFDRQNLYFEVQKPKDKFSTLTAFLKDKKERSGIIYCSTRTAVEGVCESLKLNGYNASRYHAGLSDLERHSNQEDFIYDRIQIMVATNAFGMGIDKSNVSYVVHYNMPMDMEGYYQEAGRAGRDGSPADCILLYSGQDVRTNLWLIENDKNAEYPDKETENKLKERSRERLRQMTFYCATSDCLRSYILKYFGETPPNYCGNCANCNTDFESTDVTVDAKKIISCIVRTKERYGINMIIDILRGSKNDRVLSLGLDKLSVYSISGRTDKQLRDIINQMILSGYIIKTNDEYPVIKLGLRANEILHNGETVYMKLPQDKQSDKIKISPEAKKAIASMPVDKQLYLCLQQLRLTIADEQKVPAYSIFTNSTLTDMCMKLPLTQGELLNVSGIGRIKAEQYGERFLKAIAKFVSENDIKRDESQSLVLKEFDASEIEISEDAITVSAVADIINCVLMESGNGKITGQKINSWLFAEGYIEIIERNNISWKIPSDIGLELGIISENRVIRGEDAKINLFNPAAQKYIAANALKILKFK